MTPFRTLGGGRSRLPVASTFALLLVLVAPPTTSEAQAPVTCINNAAQHRLDVAVNSSSVTEFTIAVDSGAIVVDHAGCTSNDGTTTVDKIVVKDDVGASVTVTLAVDDRFAPGFSNEAGNSDEIEFVLELGTGQDSVVVQATNARTNLRGGRDKAGGVFRPEINLNAGETRGVDGDVVLKSGVEHVSFIGGNRDDKLRMDGGRGMQKALKMPTVINGRGSSDEIVGGKGPDNLYGDGEGCEGSCAGRDSIKGGAGNDQIIAGAKNDAAFGGTGRDPIYGGPGNDKIDGNAGGDDLRGDEDDDRLRGGRGTDNCLGGRGNDQLESCEESLM